MPSILPELLERHHAAILRQWIERQRESGVAAAGGGHEDLSRQFVDALRKGAAGHQLTDTGAADWNAARSILEEMSQDSAVKGATPSETAMFVFSLKEPIFAVLQRELGNDAATLAAETWTATQLIDKFGLYTVEVYQKSREQVIARQQEELMELSTPVVQLWKGILALPLIGTLDSGRTQVVMENLLQQIVADEAEIAIIDITGVPTVDTLVAQHLLKTVSAARLMGADCIISGIRPQIAQTIVQLGIQLDVVSKATMADAFALALRRIGKRVTAQPRPTEAAPGPAGS